MISQWNKWLRFAGLSGFLMTLSHPGTVQGQTQKKERSHNACQELGRRSDTLPSGPWPNPKVRRAWLVDTLKKLLNGGTENLPCVRALLFGETYTPKLADWVVYVDTNGNVNEALTQNNEVLEPPILRGEKFVYVDAFFEGPLGVKEPDRRESPPQAQTEGPPSLNFKARADSLVLWIAGKKDDGNKPDMVRISREVLQYEPDPFLVRLVTGFGAKLFGATPQLGGEKAQADTGIAVALEDLGRGSSPQDTTHLYLAFAKLPSTDNTWSRLTIHAGPGKRLPTARGQSVPWSVLKNFATTTASRFGVSLAGGLVIDARTQAVTVDSAGRAKFVVDTAYVGGRSIIDTVPAARQVGSRWSANVYILGHWRLVERRPRPLHYDFHGFLQTGSVSVFLGTNLARGSVLDEIVGGVSIDRVFGSDVDFAVGLDRLLTKSIDTRTWQVSQEWRYRFFVGAGFEL